VDKKNAPKVNARVIRAVKEAVSQVDEKLEMNFSYGYSTYPDDSSDAEDLLERAYESVVS
jgi:GGDEF domain-containing protein